MDTTALRSAYAGFISEARQGGFGPPPDGEWSADQVVAHVAANDELLAATTLRVLDGDGHPYYNHDAIDTERLDTLISVHPDVVQWLEETSAALCDLADRLPDSDRTLVHTQIVDGTITRLDRPVPWPMVLQTQAEMHLPRHLEQLRALRP
ncbi:MAG TPA: hypothetical protein VF062_16645 [Candidatus Limnocylindrales bacterium]